MRRESRKVKHKPKLLALNRGDTSPVGIVDVMRTLRFKHDKISSRVMSNPRLSNSPQAWTGRRAESKQEDSQISLNRCHQVPNVKTTTSTMQTEPLTRRLSLSSVIFLILMLAPSWPHPTSQSRNQLVAEASTATNDVSSPTTQTASLAIATNISTANQQLKQRLQLQATFSTPNQAINITHVTYDPLHDTVYLGATNTIYQLNGSDLSVQYEQSTGPVYDNPSCGITECLGFEDNMKLTQDVNKVLVIDYQHKKLLSCGSTKQGACRRYQLDNIAQKEDLIPMAVAANDDNSTTYAFVAPARYNYDPAAASTSTANNQQQQQVLYVASTYTKVGQSRELLVPAIGTRTLDEGPNLLKLYENSFVDSRIDINSHLRDYFLVNYMYGFASSNHIYFVTVQKKATTRDFEELGYHTRLARICITDSSYNSYTEVDLKCIPNKRKSQQSKHANYFAGQQQTQSEQPSDYPLLQDAMLVDAGSQLLQSLAQSDQLPSNFFSSGGSSPDDNKVLLGVFSSAKDHTQYAGDHSALCAFSLAQIEDKFNDNINSCYTGKMQSRNMEYIAGNVQECPKSGQGGNVVNFCHETLKINGTIPIVSEAAVQYYNTTLTAITATSYVNTQVKNIYSEQLSSELTNEQAKRDPAFSSSAAKNNGPRQHTVVFAGTSSGHIKKILLNNASSGIEFEDVQLDTQPILSDLHLHSSGNQLIAATPYKVFKVPTHNCAQYASCRECSQSKNPYCGWCLLKRSCTTRSECTGAGPQSSLESRANSISSLLETASSGNGGNQFGATASKPAPSQQPKWISAESSGKCIDLQSISPDKVPMTSAGKVDLYIDRLPRLPKEHSYRCVFNRSEQTTATTTPFGLSCPLPKLMDRQRHIQIEPGRDHAIVELAVRSSETNTDFLDGKITFFDCQRHTTCKDCLTTNWGCNWCLNENVCLFNTSRCDKTLGAMQQRQDGLLTSLGGLNQNQRSRQQASSGSIVVGSTSSSSQQRGSMLISSAGTGSLATGARSSNTISLVQQCPTFDVGHQQDILIADGSERELSIRVKNMPQFKGAMKCIVEIESYEISLKAQVQEDRIICENSTYSYAAEVGLLNAQLKVIYSDSNIFIDRTNFTMYKCHLLGAYLNRPDCSLCQRIDARFACAWCSGSCQHRPRCLERPDEKCPPPRIDFVHPLSGPILGGTRVTIEGSNLGQSFEEIANRVSVGNAPCKPIEDEYRPSNRIVCLTSAAMNRAVSHAIPIAESIPGDIVVGNRAGYTIGAQKFYFKPIYLRDHQPRYGPQSGGTRLMLSGMNLNIGSSVQVFLDELPCLVELSSLTSEQLICRTSSSRQPSRPIRHLKLIIDDAQIIRDDDVFYYTSDPAINKLSPLRAYLSGGRPINVYGTNLTVVQAPRMAIHDLVTGKKVNESLCILQDDTRMQCPAPTVNLQMLDLEYAEQQAGVLSSYEPNSQQTATNSPNAWSSVRMGLSQQQQQTLQQDESIRFKLSFIMDNVQQTSFPQLQTEIAYTSDPKLYPFSSVQYRTLQEAELISASSISGQPNEQQALAHNYQVEADTFLLQPGEPTLTLHGEHLRAAVSEYEITVTVGQDLCNLTQLSQTRLVCVMPLDHMASPTDEEGHQTQRALPLVVVRIGFNLRYELGYVQYHPMLVAQIESLLVNLTSGGLTPSAASFSGGHSTRSLAHPIYKQYMPRENESSLHRLSSLLLGLIMGAGYLLLIVVLVGLVYLSMIQGLRVKEKAKRTRAYKHQLAKFESLERSLKNDCRVASLALQGDLSELVRHVELTGVPLLSMKQYIMKVFFPGINNHPLLLGSSPNASANATMLMVEQQQQQQQHPSIEIPPQPISSSNDLPLENFGRLLLTKPFLISFINTLEQQPSFTIRDRVNVASLLMIVLMERLDYATDIMKTLLFQLVERSVKQLHGSEQNPGESDAAYDIELQDDGDYEDASVMSKTTRRLTRRASNLISGLPISKRGTPTRMAASQLGKVVNGSASSLMASTSVAAQMLLARVGHKTSPLNEESPGGALYQQQQVLPNGLLDCHPAGVNKSYPGSEYMSTTTFNNMNASHYQRTARANESYRSSLSRQRHNVALKSAKARRLQSKRQAQLMLRRTDSIVEKMLTNWLALNMHDQFQGPLGQSLYLLFEALRCQLERGPIDAISGDAFYSLSQDKLLREPNIQFEMVNLYVIIETDILETKLNQQTNLLIDGSFQQTPESSQFYDQHQQLLSNGRAGRFSTTNRVSQQSYAPGNTITLALRVLDCDTISQVKGKILNALYKNLPHSCRVGLDDIELSLRRHQPHAGHQTLATNHHQAKQQYVTITLSDEDYNSVNSYTGGPRRLNTLRHYGVVDQAIMLMKRIHGGRQQAITTDDHYSSPYAEIQYGQCLNAQQQIQLTGANEVQRSRASNNIKSWHLIRSDADRTSAHLSDHSNDFSSSPSSHSPSMMLLGGNGSGAGAGQQNSTRANVSNTLLQQFYHPSSSSTSSTGNVMDTHSTSANSSSLMNVHNLVPRHQQKPQHSIVRPRLAQPSQDQMQQPIYCQIGSISAQSQHGAGCNANGGSQYYCQINGGAQLVQPASLNNHQVSYLAGPSSSASAAAQSARDSLISERENNLYLARMLTSKGTVQKYIDSFFKTILTARTPASSNTLSHGMRLYEELAPVVFADQHQMATGNRGQHQFSQSQSSACPPAVKWIFDLLDEAAMKNGIADQNVIHAWKSNAFLLRFWMNFIKNPNYFLDVDKSNTLDGSLSVIAQTLMDACAPPEDQKVNLVEEDDCSKLIFSKDLPRYRDMVKRFYQDIASMRPVSDQEMIEQMSFLSMSNMNEGSRFDTNLALKELCVYAVNYNVEIMNTLNGDCACQQLELSQQLEQCFRSFTIFEAYR